MVCQPIVTYPINGQNCLKNLETNFENSVGDQLTQSIHGGHSTFID